MRQQATVFLILRALRDLRGEPESATFYHEGREDHEVAHLASRLLPSLEPLNPLNHATYGWQDS